MLRLLALGTLSSVIAVLAGSIPPPGAQPKKNATVAPGPVPAEILTAKAAFISNAGAECNPSGAVGFSGDVDRAYDEFYEGVKAWGRYGLTAAPGGADLALEIG